MIWMQGSTAMTMEGKENALRWMALNPDWAFKIWSKDDIGPFIARTCPQHLPTWTWLIERIDKAEDPRPLYGKASDFARLLICNYHESEINVYVDDDMRPLRSLDSWMTDTEWYRHVPYEKGKFKAPEKTMSINWGGIQTIFSGEGHNNRGVMLSLCNNFILTRPHSPFIDGLIDYCTRLKAEIVLRSFGPWAITDFYYAVKKQGVTVLPWHYANWIPKEHEGIAVPLWTLSLHAQSLRWMDKANSWLAGGEKPIKKPKYQ